jgi:hypothetical protein
MAFMLYAPLLSPRTFLDSAMQSVLGPANLALSHHKSGFALKKMRELLSVKFVVACQQPLVKTKRCDNGRAPEPNTNCCKRSYTAQNSFLLRQRLVSLCLKCLLCQTGIGSLKILFVMNTTDFQNFSKGCLYPAVFLPFVPLF